MQYLYGSGIWFYGVILGLGLECSSMSMLIREFHPTASTAQHHVPEVAHANFHNQLGPYPHLQTARFLITLFIQGRLHPVSLQLFANIMVHAITLSFTLTCIVYPVLALLCFAITIVSA